MFTPAQELLGRPLIGNGSNGTAASTNGGAGGLTNGQAAVSNSNLNGTVPLTIFQNTEPIVNASINGGSSVPLLVDTGSTGLVIPLRDIGLQHLGLPTGIGMGSYSGGDTYFYLKVNGTINFGNGIVSSPTTVDAVFFSFPGSFSNFASSDGAVGILGVGASTAGPNTISPTTALPGDLGQGVLIDEPANKLVFGPNPGTVPISTATGGGSTANLTYTVGNARALLPPTPRSSIRVVWTEPSCNRRSRAAVPCRTERDRGQLQRNPALQLHRRRQYAPSVITSGSQNTGY